MAGMRWRELLENGLFHTSENGTSYLGRAEGGIEVIFRLWAFVLAAFLFCNLVLCASTALFSLLITEEARILGRRSKPSGQAKLKGGVMLSRFSVISAPSFTARLTFLGAVPTGTVRSFTVVKKMVLVPVPCGCLGNFDKGRKELMEIPNTHVLSCRDQN